MKALKRLMTGASAVALLAAGLAFATPANGAEDAPKHDPLEVVKAQGLVGASTHSAHNLVLSRNKAASARASTIRPVEINAVAPGTLPGTEAGLKVHRASGNAYGTVTGVGKNGLNAGYVIINDASAPSEYQFTVEGASTQLKLNDNGSVSVLDAQGRQINFIQPAWAKDANGKEVPTHFSVSGNTITQTVEHRGAAYPVTADPETGCGIGWCSLYFNRGETHDIATGGIAALGGATGACSLAGPVATAACGVGAAAIGSTAILADNHRKCVGLSFWGVPGALAGWNPFEYTGPQCH